jgi:transcriptional regulator with XRE-family HTH domain
LRPIPVAWSLRATLQMQRKWVVSPEYRAAIEAIKAARVGREISQRGLAERLGKPPSFVNKIEMLERRIDILEFIAMARAIGFSPAELIDAVCAALPPEFDL